MCQYPGCDIIALHKVTIGGNWAECAGIFLYYFYHSCDSAGISIKNSIFKKASISGA